MRKLLVASAVASLFAGSSSVFAQAAAPASPHTFTGNVALVSDYRFRGVSQTYKLPAVQGGFDYSHASGFYVGTWASNVSGNLYPNGAGLEWDFYGGYKFEPIQDLGIDVGVLYYWYPGAYYNVATRDKFNNTEIYLGLTYKWFSAKYSHAVSDYFGIKGNTYSGYAGINADGTPTGNTMPVTTANSRGSGYLDLNANFEIMDKTTLGLHVGHTSVRHFGDLSYTDYKIGLTRDFGWATLGAAVVGTNAKTQYYRYCNTSPNCKDPRDTTLVLSISKTF
ncbi:MAG: hypothetical protein JNK22_04635 [Rhodocyclaceae bacterium]|nr:hypothetical protein [Rhodocyclaceae bacterium]